ncbi:aryl-sulfate sulfotransferase [Candidatus Poribacteria bacterium]|nr:aryl-sulfate sulfotransferase [Candidatus Poribacteria bacterium]
MKLMGGYLALMVTAAMPVIGLNLCWGQSRTEERGVTIYKPEKAFNGYTLFCHTYEDPRVGPGGVAHMYLIDMRGKVVHEWTAKTAVQLLELLPNGNLLYSTRDRSDISKAGLREIDPESNVVWYYHCRIDHDFRVLDNGNILIHCIMDKMVPELGPELKRCPYMIEITRSKNLVWEWHGEDHIEELKELLGDRWPKVEERIRKDFTFDWAHNNTCESIPENPSGRRDGRFRKGNILFSYRSLDIIGVIDRDTGRIVWAWGTGELDGQHKPTMLPNGHILIFDNGTRRGWSRIIELDPIEERIVWQYKATPPESFFSAYISGAQLLPNGNIFICEGGRGRLFEVTRDGETVWEYKSPFRVKGTYGIYRATRYSPEYVRPLLEARSSSE